MRAPPRQQGTHRFHRRGVLEDRRRVELQAPVPGGEAAAAQVRVLHRGAQLAGECRALPLRRRGAPAHRGVCRPLRPQEARALQQRGDEGRLRRGVGEVDRPHRGAGRLQDLQGRVPRVGGRSAREARPPAQALRRARRLRGEHRPRQRLLPRDAVRREARRRDRLGRQRRGDCGGLGGERELRGRLPPRPRRRARLHGGGVVPLARPVRGRRRAVRAAQRRRRGEVAAGAQRRGRAAHARAPRIRARQAPGRPALRGPARAPRQPHHRLREAVRRAGRRAPAGRRGRGGGRRGQRAQGIPR
mmetsp:Transcript_14935/g.40904  ORF Transcript_14935/g.40904 Transcript_14935/m.40904 type:complete len:302 (-) Transcript_14935:1313-2218(-)